MKYILITLLILSMFLIRGLDSVQAETMTPYCETCEFDCCEDECSELEGGYLDKPCPSDKPYCVNNGCQTQSSADLEQIAQDVNRTTTISLIASGIIVILLIIIVILYNKLKKK